MNDPAFRILGFSIGLCVVAALWFAARTFRHSVPLSSLALLGMSPSLIVWGDSIRAYGFGIAVVLMAGALLWRFVEEPSPARFALAAVAAIASVHALFYNSVLLLAFCAGAFAVCALNRAWKKSALVVLIGLVAAISIVPYATTIRDARRWDTVVRMPDYDLAWFREMLDETLRPAGQWALGVWVVLFALAVFVGVRAVRRPASLAISPREREVALFSIVTLVVAVVAIFLFLENLSYYTRPWYYLSLLAVGAVYIDAVFGAVIHSPAHRIARLGVVLLIAGATFVPAVHAVRKRMTNVDVIASRLSAMGRPDDLVLINSSHTAITFARYYRGTARWMTVPFFDFHRFHRYDIIQKNMMLADQRAPVRPVIDRARETLRAGHRVFVVGQLDFSTGNEPPNLLPPAPLPGIEPWPERLYNSQWSSLVGDFLQTHSTRIVAVPVMVAGPVSDYENVQLFTAEGWRP
ncbi:MAG: hypothetical protein ABIW94_12615 [Gemmatimonadaceae bacterium]